MERAGNDLSWDNYTYYLDGVRKLGKLYEFDYENDNDLMEFQTHLDELESKSSSVYYDTAANIKKVS